MSKLILDWKQVETDTYLLAEKLVKTLPDYKDVQLVCITRGGLFVGGLLSYMLGMKNVHCVALSSYKEENNSTQSKIESLTHFLPNADKTKTYLFVDDVNDTSETYKYVRAKSAELGLLMYFASTYHKDRTTNLLPDFYGTKLSADAWIVFPWDQLSK